MRIKPRFFQEGGEMAPPEDPAMAGGAPPEGGGGGDPLMQLVQMAAQALQAQDPNMAMQVCQALVQLAQGGGGGEPAAPEGEPVFRKGGKLAYRIKR